MANLQRQTQITAAALKLFDERGFHGTGMGHLSKAVGMSASSLYNHFSSKQEVLAEVLRTTMERLLREHASELAGITDPVERLRVSMAFHVRFHAENAMDTRVVNQEILNLQEPTLSIVRQLRRDYVARWMLILKEGEKSGKFQVKDIKITCYSLIDMGIGTSLWFNPDSTYSASQLGEIYAEAALRQCGIMST